MALILKNPVYIGKVVWDRTKHVRKGARGNPKHITIQQTRDHWVIVDGLHPAIIDKELFGQVQDIMAGRYIPPANDGTIKSPLAGLVKCAVCGRNMQRWARYGYPLSALQHAGLLRGRKARHLWSCASYSTCSVPWRS